MVPLAKLGASLLLGAVVAASASGGPFPDSSAGNRAATSALFVQSAAQILQRDFQSKEVSYLLLDARTGILLASRWDGLGQPIPMGSLVKPFITVAYGDAHQFHYPAYVCKGEVGGCWLPRGHGELDIVSAIAFSCNSYFRMLTANMSSADVIPVARQFGLEMPTAKLSGSELIGVGNRWLISPMQMAGAYAELNRRRNQPGAREALAGMAQSAMRGTGSKVGQALKHSGALVKTGTAACTHVPGSPGDGFVIALFPAEQPELLLMVRVHGVPGAKASVTAGRMLSRIEE
jgi:cell division protein FtsI/penicillin-binding protein 2